METENFDQDPFNQFMSLEDWDSTHARKQIMQIDDVTGELIDTDEFRVNQYALDPMTTRFLAAKVWGETERLDIIVTPDRYAIAHGGDFDWADRSAFDDLDDVLYAYLNDHERFEAAN